MNWSPASGLRNKDLDARDAGGARDGRKLSGAGARNISTLPLCAGSLLVSSPLPEAKSACAGGPGRVARVDLPQRAGDLHTAADLYPLLRNAATTRLRSEGPAALHPRRELPHHAPGDRRLVDFHHI